METINHTAQGMSVSNKDWASNIPLAPRQPLFRNAQYNPINLRIRNWRTSPPGSLARSSAGYWWEPLSFSTRPVVMDLPPLPRWSNTRSSRLFNLRTRDWYSSNKFSHVNFAAHTNLYEQRQLQLARDLYLSRAALNEPISYDQIQSSSFGHGFASVPLPPPLPTVNHFRQGQSQLAHPHRARPLRSLRTRDWKMWNGSQQACWAIDQRRNQLFREAFFTRQPTVTFAEPVAQTTYSQVATPMSNTFTTTTVAPAVAPAPLLSTLPAASPAYVAAPFAAPIYTQQAPAPVYTQPIANQNYSSSSASSSSGSKLSLLSQKLKSFRSSRSSKHTVSEPAVQTAPVARQTMAAPVPTTVTYAPAVPTSASYAPVAPVTAGGPAYIPTSAPVANTNSIVYSTVPNPATTVYVPVNTITATSTGSSVAPSAAFVPAGTTQTSGSKRASGLVKVKSLFKHKSAQQTQSQAYGSASN